MKFFVLICFIKCAVSLAPTENFTYNRTLISPDLFTVFWKHDKTEATFEIHFKDSRWAMFGIWGSNFSDVIMAWLNNDQTGHFSDQRLLPNNELILDSEHNWILLDAFYKDGTNVFKFKRFIDLSCKTISKEDLNIQPGLIKIVFATGNNLNPIKIAEPNQIEFELLSNNYGPYSCPIPVSAKVLNSKPTEYYSNIFELIPGVYNLYWNYTDTEIVFEIHCKTNGWVGFGLSPNGGMDKSDVVIGWISDGRTNFTDRHIQGRSVLIDEKQDWHLLKSYESNGVNVFKFKRSIKLCDPDDSIIVKGTPNVIFAFGLNDPLPGQDINYHNDNRGSTKINLITSSKVNVQNDEPDSEILDINIENLVLPKQDTYYYCKGFKIPKNLTQKRHIYKYEFIFPEINYKRMHHSLLYECEPGYDGENPKYEDGECYTDSIKGKYCQVISLGWAVGGEKVFYFPKDAGYPIGGDTEYSFLVLELHYDNPKLDIGFIQKSTLRFHLTKNLRQKELGVLTLGTDSSPYGIAIPPQMDQFSIKSYCFNDCLNQKLSDQNINIISANPHTHLSGLEVSTKIIRKGKDIGYLFRNEFYDFNYQNSYILNPPVQITKDDELITECIYKTRDRTKFTYGGLGTRQEMCYHFLTYYPRQSTFKNCLSVPSGESYYSLIQQIKKNENLNLPEFNSSTFYQTVNKMYQLLDKKQISDNLRKTFKEFYDNTKVSQICGKYTENQHEQIKISELYVEPDPCKEVSQNDSKLSNVVNMIVNFFRKIFNFFSGLF